MLEFKHNESERGKTLLDNVLTSYPKRTDIWSMYVDVLVKNEDIAAARYFFTLQNISITLVLRPRFHEVEFFEFSNFFVGIVYHFH